MISKVKNKAQRARLIRIQQSQVKNILTNNYSVFEPAMCKGVMMFGRDCKPVGISQTTADALGRYEQKWSISCYLLCRDKNGKNKLVPAPGVVDISTPCKHSDIREKVASIQWEAIESYQWQETILTAAWIANTLGNEPTEEQAYNMFDVLGCWSELVADWEQPND